MRKRQIVPYENRGASLAPRIVVPFRCAGVLVCGYVGETAAEGEGGAPLLLLTKSTIYERLLANRRYKNLFFICLL